MIARNFDIFCSFWMNNHFVKLQTQFSSIVDFEMLISFSFDHFWELFLLLIHRTQWFLNSKLSFGICIWDLSIIFLLFEDFSNFTALHCSHFGVLKLTDFHTESRLKLSRISCTRFSFCLASWAARTLHNKAENPCRLSVVCSPCLIAPAGLRESLVFGANASIEKPVFQFQARKSWESLPSVCSL